MPTLDEHNDTVNSAWEATFTPITNNIPCPLDGCSGTLEDIYPGLATLQRPPQTPVKCNTCPFTGHRSIDRTLSDVLIGNIEINNAGAGNSLQVDTNAFIVDGAGDCAIGKTPVTGSKLNLPSENDAATPTLSFGDGDTGFYERTDDDIGIAIGGFLRWSINSTDLTSTNTSGGLLTRAAATATLPAHAFRDDSNTGIGRAAADQLSLIAGGVELMRLTQNDASADQITSNSEISITIADTVNSAGLTVNQNDTTNNPNAATIINAGTGSGLFIDQNGNGIALNIDAESTTANVLNINSATTTTGNVLNIGDASSLTIGNVARFSSASTSPSARNILELVNLNSASTGCTVLKLEQNSPQTALFIDQNANGSSLVIDSESTTVNIIHVLSPTNTTGSVIRITDANSLTTGRLLSLASNSADTGTRALIRLVNENTLATGTTCLEIQQDAANQAMIIDQNAASSFIDYQGTAAANATDPISTLTTSGATTHHIQIEINGVKAWIACSTTNPS